MAFSAAVAATKSAMCHPISNPRWAREELGWTPKVTFYELVRMMIEADVALVSRKRSREP